MVWSPQFRRVPVEGGAQAVATATRLGSPTAVVEQAPKPGRPVLKRRFRRQPHVAVDVWSAETQLALVDHEQRNVQGQVTGSYVPGALWNDQSGRLQDPDQVSERIID